MRHLGGIILSNHSPFVSFQACLLEACSSPEDFSTLHHLGLVLGVSIWEDHFRAALQPQHLSPPDAQPLAGSLDGPTTAGPVPQTGAHDFTGPASQAPGKLLDGPMSLDALLRERNLVSATASGTSSQDGSTAVSGGMASALVKEAPEGTLAGIGVGVTDLSTESEPLPNQVPGWNGQCISLIVSSSQ